MSTAPLDVVREALLGRRVGSILTIDDVRAELKAGGIRPASLGTCLRNAVRREWLKPVGAVPVKERSGNGRLVRTYKRLPIGPQGIGPRPSRRPAALFDLDTERQPA